ncbi:hypothetical protein SAMN05421770_105270 [Granulicella rosea]|uniref:Uncharacterized protein n=1 Tax=Granulicella rosea TaxID=474952 RepID=A0A239KYE9_9BACT|nr:hypothetical protein [Granulicella rosea]SNT22529.1 hypothetical protein SAMN05421770_105270 [Granulicella rosea]
MDLSPRSNGRMVVALIVMAVMAVSVLWTMEPGKYRNLVWILLGFFTFRILLGRLGSR